MRKATRNRAIDASPGTVLRGRRPCTRREVSCTEAGRSPPCPARRRRAAQGRPRAVRLGSQQRRSRMRSYYLRSRRTKATSLRRWWREGAQPKGTPNRTPHSGHRAGIVVRRWACKAYVRRRAGIGGCGSRRSCITLRHSYSMDSFYSLQKNAAAGVDGVTWREYEKILPQRVPRCIRRSMLELIGRHHPGGYTFPKRMADSARWGSPRSRTRSCNRPSSRC